MARERAARARAPPFIDPPRYTRHSPEATLLYQFVERCYPELVAAREAAGRPLPKYVQDEFAAYLKCGRLEHGFLRVRCEDCHAEKLVAFSCKRRGFCPSCGARRMTDSVALLADEVLPPKPLRQWVLSLSFALGFLLATDAEALSQVLGIAYRTISAHVLKKTGLARTSGATGAVTLIQRFGSALNLNIHFHMLVLDGAYLVGTEPPVFRRMAPPGEAELQALVERLAERVGRAAGGPIDDLLGHSITYRVAVGPRAGQKVFSLQTVPGREEGPRKGVAQYARYAASGLRSDREDDSASRSVEALTEGSLRAMAGGAAGWCFKIPIRSCGSGITTSRTPASPGPWPRCDPSCPTLRSSSAPTTRRSRSSPR